jgi:hypothetical protein
MADELELALEEALREIEFPGAEEKRIGAYLEERHFVDRVMAGVARTERRTGRTILWGAFALLNLLLLVVLGASQPVLDALKDTPVVEDVGEYLEAVPQEAAPAQFFFLFLGLTFVGSLVGLVLSRSPRRSASSPLGPAVRS